MTGGGYDGHYFWDTEVYVLPFLAYTNPEAARKLLRFRFHMLDAARARATELSQRGALYPWRTINGEEASAYYAAGTAQYHINAAIVYALEKYLNATGDMEFLAHEGAEILVETARLYQDLGLLRDQRRGALPHPRCDRPRRVHDRRQRQPLHERDGPVHHAVRGARWSPSSASGTPDAYARRRRRTGVTEDEIAGWHRACDAMFIPYDAGAGHPPPGRELPRTGAVGLRRHAAGEYPLLLHFHPLVIYRHQVLKQADVVLAMYLRGEHFDVDQKRRNFDYYDPITTGDSSLSACVQSIVAAEVGYDDLALDYFNQSLYLDLADTHGNTSDGAHIANAGGVWAGLVYGFAGLIDTGDHLEFRPRMPGAWSAMTFRLRRHGSSLRVTIDRGRHDDRRDRGALGTRSGPATGTDVRRRGRYAHSGYATDIGLAPRGARPIPSRAMTDALGFDGKVAIITGSGGGLGP